MNENSEYNIGYFEGVRAAFLIWNQNLVRYESDGVVELQLNSEKFFTELEAKDDLLLFSMCVLYDFPVCSG